jgi:hypothetical protein
VSADARRLVLAWTPAALYMALIWTVSSIEAPTFPVSLFPFRDKGVHATEYAVLAFLLGHACVRTFERHPRWRVAVVAVFLTVLWGFLDELHQAFVPGRSSDVLDLVADTIGAVMGTSARMVVARLWPKTTDAGALA